MTFKAWLVAARLRTLPLALACTIAGLGVAYHEGPINILSACFTIITIIFLQILSNFANDLGDFKKGTDSEERIGPKRGLQSGTISEREMKAAVIIFSVLSFISGSILLTISLSWSYSMLSLFILGLIAIGAALKYTLGRKSFAYSGLGDLVVFVFFGIVGLMGTVYLQTNNVLWQNIIPAAGIGLLATAVLNLNNLRDHINDAKHGKNTLIVRLGFSNGKIYHGILLGFSFVLFVIFGVINSTNLSYYFCLLPFLILVVSLYKLIKTGKNNTEGLNSELGKTAISTALLSIGFAIFLNC